MPIHDLIEPRTAAPRRRLGARLGEAGAAMVEFGFVAPIFIAIVCAIMEFSGIMFVQALLEGSAREARATA
jgi:Flp pilus assembly protein TadG